MSRGQGAGDWGKIDVCDGGGRVRGGSGRVRDSVEKNKKKILAPKKNNSDLRGFKKK